MKTLSWSFMFLRCVVCIISQEREINGNILKNHFCRMITRIYKYVNKKSNSIWKTLRKLKYMFSVKESVRNKQIVKRVMHDQDFLRLGSGFSFSVQRKFYWNALLITDYMSFFAFKWFVFAFEISGNFC